MEKILNELEVRILGALIEKEITTPDYYPLTLNSLTLACNQKSNRFPVLKLEDKIVARALDSLRRENYVYKVTGADIRVPKYEQYFSRKMNFTEDEVALICVLFLRGPQTPGELRIRSERLYQFKDIESVKLCLQQLMNRDKPLVKEMSRVSGQKENRFCHLFCGDARLPASEKPIINQRTTIEVRSENNHIKDLEERVANLEEAFMTIKTQFTKFVNQFE